ncbi:MAG: CBS domain-containing protein [Planctomycetes bacterium]|nr:CBS domain-containing protein [Planctomycetota bacterium]MBI3846974.1 CBS domain-containing protein [Planctomycetota bacterium]
MKVSEVMTRDVKTCRPEDCLNVPAQLMWDRDCGCVPVVDAEMRVVGLITDRDIAMAAYTQGTSLSNSNVESAMAKQVHRCHPDDPLTVAERIMQTQQVRRLPVTDAHEKLLGIISLNDLAREAIRERGGHDKVVALQAVANTLAAICEPRVPAVSPATTARKNGEGRRLGSVHAAHTGSRIGGLS